MSAITWAAWLVVKVTCLFLVALAFDALLRRRWVLITAALWNAMLVALVVLPAAALLGPRVELPLLAADAAAESAPNGAPIARAAGGRRPPVPADHAPAVDRAVAQPPPNDADASARWPTDEPRSNERVAWHFLAIALGWLYAAGVAVVAVRLAASWRAVDGLLALRRKPRSPDVDRAPALLASDQCKHRIDRARRRQCIAFARGGVLLSGAAAVQQRNRRTAGSRNLAAHDRDSHAHGGRRRVRGNRCRPDP